MALCGLRGDVHTAEHGLPALTAPARPSGAALALALTATTASHHFPSSLPKPRRAVALGSSML